jgi:hypothetical protein
MRDHAKSRDGAQDLHGQKSVQRALATGRSLRSLSARASRVSLEGGAKARLIL